MAVKVEAFRLSGRVEVENKRARTELRATERDAKAVAESFKGLKGEVGSLRGSLSRGGGFLPGLAQISEVIQGIPQIGRLAGALVSPLTDAAQAGIQFNAFLETNEIALKRHFDGSRESARGFINEIRDFAGKSPFRTEGLIKSVIYGTATGFSPREALQLVKDVGDAIASTGEISEETVQGVVRALSQMKAKGTVSAEEMEQLAERGIPAWEMLAHAIGKTVAETRKLSERGKLNGPAAVTALRAEMRARYGGMMDELQGTLTGRLSAAQDAVQSATAKAMEGTTANISSIVGDGLQRAGLVDSLAATINGVLTPVSGLLKTAASGILGGGITGGLVEGIGLGKDAIKAVVKDMALDGILGTAKEWLGINSPSLRMMEIGEGVGEGFEIGAVESLDEAQKAIIAKIVEIGRRAGATTDEIKAALATGWVESRFRNLNHGDRDSRGVMQQRPSQGWGTAEQVMNIDHAAQKFYAEAMRRRGRNLSPGALAQSVQRSAYPDRYEQALPFVNTLIRNLGEGAGIEPGRVRQAWQVLKEFAEMRGFTVTSTTGGKHGPRSAHGDGNAIDIRTKDKTHVQVEALIDEMRARGVYVVDERNKPGQPHLHAQFGTKGIKAGAAHLYCGPSFMSGATPLNPVPVTVVSGGKFGMAPQSIGHSSASENFGRQTIQDTGTVLIDVNESLGELVSMSTQVVGAEGLHFYRTQQLTQATERQTVAAGQFASTVIGSVKKMDAVMGAFGQLAGMLPNGGQVGKKRGFFSKMLGFAAPFLSFIPGVGPILSSLAGMGSAALAGDWGGVVSGAAAGFSSGGVFRGSSNAPLAPQAVNFTNPATRRALGGPVRRGSAYIVGDGGREEVFIPQTDGMIHPDAAGYSRRGNASGGWGAMVARLMQMIEQNTQIMGRIGSASPGSVFVAGARSADGRRAITDGFMRHGSQDPRVLDWMQRRVLNPV